MRERDIERALSKALAERGCLSLKFLGTERGIPDRIVIGNGAVCFVETKNGTHGRLSKMQEWQHERLRKAGAEVFVIRTADEARRFAADFAARKKEGAG